MLTFRSYSDCHTGLAAVASTAHLIVLGLFCPVKRQAVSYSGLVVLHLHTAVALKLEKCLRPVMFLPCL